MTFTEAALAVLEREGRPMHAREIAEKAVEMGILSHVGKTPVQTMSGRLSAAVQRADGTSLFVRTKPGVFALSAWSGKAPGPRSQSVTATTSVSRPTPPPPKPPPQVEAASAAMPFAVDLDESEDASEDIPIITAAEALAEANRSKRKRRRKRSKRNEDEPSVQPPSSAAAQEAPPAAPPPKEPLREEEQRAISASKPRPPVATPPPEESLRVCLDSDDVLERVLGVLRQATRPLPASHIAERMGKLGAKGTWLVEALLTGDNLGREQQGHRPRFVERRAGWTLSEKELSSEMLAAERTVAEARQKLTRFAEKQVLRRLRTLSPMAFGKAMILYLQACGYEGIRPVDKGGKDELHLTVSDSRAGRRFRTAVVLRRGGPEDVLSEHAVIELRGALHHYDAASILYITTGMVSDAAKKEACVPNLAPISLVDAESLAHDMVRLGLGVDQRLVALPSFDESFFGALAE